MENKIFIRLNKNNKDYFKEQAQIIKEYVEKNDIELSSRIISEVNNPKDEKNIKNDLLKCNTNCTIIVSDINVFGRTLESIVNMIKILIKRDIKVVCIKQKYEFIKNDQLTKVILSIIKTTIDVEKNLMSLRTKEVLIQKKLDGISLGKPLGTIQKSKFDTNRDKIEELMSLGLSIRKISKLLGYSNHIGLNNYVKKRNIKSQIIIKK